MTTKKSPDWYDEKKLRKVWYDVGGLSGWVIDCGDGTCRYVNNPLLGEDGPRWGDRVRLLPVERGLPVADASQIIERYAPPDGGN